MNKKDFTKKMQVQKYQKLKTELQNLCKLQNNLAHTIKKLENEIADIEHYEDLAKNLPKSQW